MAARPVSRERSPAAEAHESSETTHFSAMISYTAWWNTIRGCRHDVSET